MNFYYNGVWRMDWGLGNPNKTAILIACLMLAVWAMPVIWKRSFWPVLIIFTALAWCLVQTYSRGGMVAFLLGMGILLAWIPRPWPKERWIAAVASLWILGGFVLYSKAQARYGQGLFTEDQSINSRLVVWGHAPEMMAAAPWGWGAGKAGDAYTQWYQPTDQSGFYLNLINSHLTWMVEWGWLASTVYIFLWLVILLLCWPAQPARIQAIPLAIWTTLGVGAFFSHVEGSVWLWVIPLPSLVYVISERRQARQWPSISSFIMSGAASLGIVVILVLTGFATSSFPITAGNGIVTIGRGSTKTLVFVDRQVMGPYFGKTFRKFMAKEHDELFKNTFVLVESEDSLPANPVKLLVISGKFIQSNRVISYLSKGKKIIFVNPAGFPDEAGFNKNLVDNMWVYFGEYSQAPSRSSWSNYPGIKTLQIDGASDFVPAWPQAILPPHKT
jgi:hypothetical protein